MPPKESEKLKSTKRGSAKKGKRTESDQLKITESFPNMATASVSGGGEHEISVSDSTPDVDLPEDKFDLLMKRLDEMQASNSKQFSDLDMKITKRLDDIETKFANQYKNIQTDVKKHKEDIKKINTTITEIQTSVTFTGDKVGDLEKMVGSKLKETKAEFKALLEQQRTELENKHKEQVLKLNETVKKMKEENIQLKDHITNMDKHSRKYNLLLYGIKDPPKGTGFPKENIDQTVRNFFKSEMKMDPALVDGMLFANVHRLDPRPGGPTPIIVRFIHYSDREAVFSRVKDTPKGFRIFTDLPVDMKKERNRLAKIAYDLRNHTDINQRRLTKIVDEGVQVFLLTRKTSADSWEKLSV